MKKAIIIMAVIVFIILVLQLTIELDFNKKKEKYDKYVPIIKINLKNTTQEEINNNSKEKKYKNNSIHVFYNDKRVLSDSITIKGRGNTTWCYIKKPYQISFDKNINLFNLGESKKWVLLANYFDETLLRNHMAFYLGKKINMPYVSNGINIDLYIDNEYQGVYYLTPKIGINKASVNLKNDDGIIMELDNMYYFEEDNYYITNYYKDHFVVKDIKNMKSINLASHNFMNKYNEIEKSINDNDWNSIIQIIDIDSFARYYILNSLVRNGDAYRSSFYMYQDGKNDKIHAGPIWDFDLAFSSDIMYKNYFAKSNCKSSFQNVNDIENGNFNNETQIMYNLLKFDEFKNNIRTIWNNELKNTLNDFLLELDKQSNIVRNSAIENIKKWNYLSDYDSEIANYKKTIQNLYNEFDNDINKK